ncbi:MAG: HAMP domain-containing protein [Phenylobacterium sp.]|nr:MAG: HAMP domain-containing protein [Phenylobacterium sp.]
MSAAEAGGKARRRTRAPIGLQLVALLVACLLGAQAISFAMITLMPPPRPQVYRAFEIAGALRGTPVTPRLGRPLARSIAAQLSGDLASPPVSRMNRGLVTELAAELGASEADVRIVAHEHRPPWDRPRRRPRGEGPPPPGWPGDRAGSGAGGGRRSLRFPPGSPAAAEMPIFGDVEAAVRRPAGGWVVVRSQPEAFPTEWEERGALWLAVGFLLVAPAGLLFARRITAPLKKFSEAADQLGRDPTAPPLTLSGPAEIGVAAAAFNEMQARLRRYIDDRTGMVGAISHDLRTPLARIRFKMERAPAELRHSVLADVGQMEQMIGDVLAFIRDEGEHRQRERLDLLSLVECVADDAALLGGDVEIAESHPLTIEGDPVGLQRLFANLVDNAVKYGAVARIEMTQEGTSAVVTIKDAGPGLSAHELERVFLPFYRTDASRNLDNGGVGLGLPIARATARAHGGDVELSSTAQGVVARVSLPLAA